MTKFKFYSSDQCFYPLIICTDFFNRKYWNYVVKVAIFDKTNRIIFSHKQDLWTRFGFLFSNLAINISNNTVPYGEPYGFKLVWPEVLPTKVESTPFVHSKIIYLFYLFLFLVIDVLVSFLLYIRFRMISMAVSRGTLAKRDTTSDKTIIRSLVTFCCLMKLINLFVLFIVYWLSIKGNNNCNNFAS